VVLGVTTPASTSRSTALCAATSLMLSSAAMVRGNAFLDRF
jgi:hypothetical protein